MKIGSTHFPHSCSSGTALTGRRYCWTMAVRLTLGSTQCRSLECTREWQWWQLTFFWNGGISCLDHDKLQTCSAWSHFLSEIRSANSSEWTCSHSSNSSQQRNSVWLLPCCCPQESVYCTSANCLTFLCLGILELLQPLLDHNAVTRSILLYPPKRMGIW